MSIGSTDKLPSLERAFAPEEQALQKIYSENELSTAQIVTEARRALDRTGAIYSHSVSDPKLQRAGLWLLEIIKSGAGVLDQAVGTDLIWHEVANPVKKGWTAQSLFFAVAAALAVYGFLQQNRLVVYTVAILALFRLLEPVNLRAIRSRLPFSRSKPQLLEDQNQSYNVEAKIITRTQSFIASIREALKTADHILLRLAEPESDSNWHDNPRLLGLMQGLLEARTANDGEFALKLIGQELESVLSAEGITQIEYTAKTAHLFDVLPAPGFETPKLAAPALMAGEAVIRRGTVWSTHG